MTSSAGGAGVAALAQHPQHLLAGLGVQGAGGLVGEHQPAVADEGAGDGDPLLLAAGHLVREPVGQVGRRRPRSSAAGAAPARPVGR